MSEDTLPKIRDDLELIAMGPDDEGAPTWLIYDQIQHKYYIIGWLEFEIIARWHSGSADDIVNSVNRETTLHIKKENIALVLSFLTTNELLITDDFENATACLERKKTSVFKKLLHSYLFFMVPLASPDQFLEKTLPYIRFLFTKKTLIALCIIACFSFYFVIRQWDDFIGSFNYLFNFENMVAFVISIIVVKIIHELSHAYVAKYFSCRVSTIGVAFIVMWPVMYTDTTDAWKLQDKNQRMAIAAAGMSAEIALAVLAMFFWNFVPPGVIKSILVFIASISWVSSLVININPLLRYDGYYLFSDLIGIENLQSTSFAIAKWKLREWLFKFDEPAPILYPKDKEKIILAYAFFVWCYRFVLFLSIAIFVYYLFFKALGVLLMLVEIIYFIVLPIVTELKNYWIRRKNITLNNNAIITWSVFFVVIILFFVPWQTNVSAPATLEYTHQTKLFAKHDGEITQLNFVNGKEVKQGQLIVAFNNPMLDSEIGKTKYDIIIIENRLRQETNKSRELGYKQASPQDLASLNNKLQNLMKESEQLQIVAPFSGKFFSNNQGYSSGVWVGKDSLIGELINSQSPVVYGYVQEKDLQRLRVGQSAVFYPKEKDNDALDLKLVEIDPAATDVLTTPYLASLYGGNIAVTKNQEKNELDIQESLYRVKLVPGNSTLFINHIITGSIVIKGNRESYAERLWRLTVTVLIRESGF